MSTSAALCSAYVLVHRSFVSKPQGFRPTSLRTSAGIDIAQKISAEIRPVPADDARQ